MEGAFRLINPVTRMEAGQIVLGMGWHNPLRLPGEPPASGKRGPSFNQSVKVYILSFL